MFTQHTLDSADTTLYHASLVSAWSREPYIVAVSYGTDLQLGGRQYSAVPRRARAPRCLPRPPDVAPRLSRAFRPPDDDRPADDAAQGSDPMIRAAHRSRPRVCVCTSMALAQEPPRSETRSRHRRRPPRLPAPGKRESSPTTGTTRSDPKTCSTSRCGRTRN